MKIMPLISDHIYDIQDCVQISEKIKNHKRI